MTLLKESDEDIEHGRTIQYWRDDDMRLIKIVVAGGDIISEEDMEECACVGCWENR